MKRAFLDERRYDAKVAVMVQRAICIEAESGYVRAARYLIHCGVAKEVIERVLLYPAGRRFADTRSKAR